MKKKKIRRRKPRTRIVIKESQKQLDDRSDRLNCSELNYHEMKLLYEDLRSFVHAHINKDMSKQKIYVLKDKITDEDLFHIGIYKDSFPKEFSIRSTWGEDDDFVSVYGRIVKGNELIIIGYDIPRSFIKEKTDEK